jgi:hypothetical protein
LDIKEDSKMKISSGFILYEIIQSMLEKMFKFVERNTLDVKKLEKNVFA